MCIRLPEKRTSVLNNELCSNFSRKQQGTNTIWLSRSTQLYMAFNLITSITNDYRTHVMQNRNHPNHYNPRVQKFMLIIQRNPGIGKMYEMYASSKNSQH